MSSASRVSLSSSVALVTGATGGIGHAIARALAARGARLIITGRRAEVLQELATELDARAVACDLSSRDDVAALASEAIATAVDVVVANAGLPASGVFTDLSQEQIDTMLEVNLRAPIALARALAPSMIEHQRGHMVFVSSLSGKTASPASSIYSATKFGLRGFAQGIRADLRPHGVGVSTVFPGFIRDAGMFADTELQLPRGVGTRTPRDVAEAIVRAIDEDRAELDVAPLGLRVGSTFASVAPQLAATVSRRFGSHEIATSMAERQRPDW